MDSSLLGLGKHIKKIRRKKGKTIYQIAQHAQVSAGLISRIENNRTVPSLPVFLKIIDALEENPSSFFNTLQKEEKQAFFVFRRKDYEIIEKEDDAIGFTYYDIFGKQFKSIAFNAILLEIAPNSQREKVTTDAYELKFMISGQCDYHIGENSITLYRGDSLFFDGRIPHVPINRSDAKATMLVVYFYLETK